jgi:hypothetical protein
MKTANVKACVKDMKAGVTVYTAHPVYGIDKRVITGRPYMESNIGLFVPCILIYSQGQYVGTSSLCDMGVSPGNSYNGRRTFFKLKHAQAWMDKWATDKGFIADHARHEEMCEMMDDWDYSDY